MKSVLPLRLASALAFVSFLLHTYLFQLYEPLKGKDELVSLSSLHNVWFALDSPFLRDYLDLYVGYGIFVVIATLVESVLLWQLAELEKAIKMSMRSIVVVILAGEMGYAWLMWRNFFLYPLIVHAVMVVLLTSAILVGGPSPKYRAA